MEAEENIAFEAASNALKSTRRTLWLITGLICLGLFYQYQWYFSWENARITGRNAIILRIDTLNLNHKYLSGSQKSDSIIRKNLIDQVSSIEDKQTTSRYTLPLINIDVASSDFSVAILIVSVSLLLWLRLYLNRLRMCLKELERFKGYEIVKTLLKFQFVLVSEDLGQENPNVKLNKTCKIISFLKFNYIKIAMSIFVWGLPFLAILFLSSDIYDCNKYYCQPILHDAFLNNQFLFHVVFRLAMDFLLSILLCILGLSCFKSYLKMEKDLLTVG